MDKFFAAFRSLKDAFKSLVSANGSGGTTKCEQPTTSKNEELKQDKETLPVIETSPVLSKKDLLFKQCSIGKSDECNVPILEDLIREVGPNAKNELSETPLLVAQRSVNYVVVETLLKNGADAMIRYGGGKNTIADLIFYCGDMRLISTYLPYHKDIDALLNNLYETALHIAAAREGPNFALSLLKRNAAPNIKDKYGRTPLHVAVERGSPKVTEILLRFGANVNAQSNDGSTPLHYACSTIDTGCIDKLLRYKCSVNVQDAEGHSPLYYFIKFPLHHYSLLEKLLNSGCKIEDAAKSFKPLHMLAKEEAFRDNAVSYAKILIRKGLDVNEVNRKACTALHIAARFSNERFVKCLLENGACFNMLNSSNLTPLDVSLRWSKTGNAMQIVRTVSVHMYEGKPVIKEILDKIGATELINVFFLKFCREVLLLSERNSIVSYMDIYRADWSTLYEYTKNKEIVKYLEEFNVDKFPFYGKDIQRRFHVVLRRSRAVESGIDSLNFLFHGRLPFLCLKHITQYLTSGELEKLSN